MANLYPGFEQLFVNALTKALPPSVIERLALDLRLADKANASDLTDKADRTDLQGLASNQAVIDLANLVGTLQRTVADLTAIVQAVQNEQQNKANKKDVRAFVEQSGSTYPTPPVGYPALDVNGALNPATQSGFVMGEFDVWNSGAGA